MSTILITKETGFGIIQINRPEALNALNSQVFSELYSALRDFDSNDEIFCTIVTGNEKAFAAGADIKEMAPYSSIEMLQRNQFEFFDKIQTIKKPIIAAVNGFALGGGCELAMICDIIIASDTAKFGQPEVNLGVIPGMGGTQRLINVVGKYKAMELILTGDTFSAQDALQWGLAVKAVPSANLLDEAKSMAKKIASKAPLAIQLAKESIIKSLEVPMNEGLNFERKNFYALFSSDDQKEGMKAFMEKRKATWKNK